MTSVRTIAAALLSAGCICLAVGCGHTLSGASQDVSQDTQQVKTDTSQAVATTAAATKNAVAKTEAAAHNADQAAKNAVSNAGAATTVTPEVKLAIIRDPVLNDPANHIKVSSHNHEAVLIGTVTTADMKERATEDAQVVLDKRHPDFKVVNDLTVTGGQ